MGKYYAVKKGYKTGIFENWEECKSCIKGYSDAQYKVFHSREEAEDFLKLSENVQVNIDNKMSPDKLREDELIIYSDGSYDDKLKLSSFGIVYLQNGLKEYYYSGVVVDKNGTRNVIGEITGVLKSLEYASQKNKTKVYIYHDYAGISKRISGEWNANSSDALYYVSKVNEYSSKIEIHFFKVKAHSGDRYNEICDKLAKNELKSLLPSTNDSWGFKSYKFTDDVIKETLNEMKNDVKDFRFTVKEEKNLYLYTCFLGKEKMTFQKYKFNSTNQLVIPFGNKSSRIYSLLLTYLNDHNSIISILGTFNVNNSTDVSESLIKEKLYELAPSLRNNKINITIYKLLVQGVYNLFLNVRYFKDCSFLTTPILRALEGQLKLVFKDKLQIEISNNSFHYFDKDPITNVYSLQATYSTKLDNQTAKYINDCYNLYSRVRHKLLHFGDLDVDDTMMLSKENSQNIIIDIIKLIDKYYK